jgi:hypothetical protein
MEHPLSHLLEQAFIFLKDPHKSGGKNTFGKVLLGYTKNSEQVFQVSLENLPEFEVCQTPFLSILTILVKEIY